MDPEILTLVQDHLMLCGDKMSEIIIYFIKITATREAWRDVTVLSLLKDHCHYTPSLNGAININQMPK